ncbi:HEPN domain-containing protein [Desulfitobacterium sp.]|uniref:HEPN domain-containing protein n=1 Tax=Desulfitobacterium sp. TaxID=49981 RepID=UPI002C020698|nr:HEPN domain-containing protein [Desulfitobacterium sp.]HVJ49916.1 HEPN domain-containing protein [Desulfitobacterium sp.]
MAKKDLQSAQILFEHDADYGIVCFHLQQAVEKYLKGYLIRQMGILQDGHSLVKLCKKATSYEAGFKAFLKDTAFLNTYYIETRYPAEDPLKVDREDVEECFRISSEIMNCIDKLT